MPSCGRCLWLVLPTALLWPVKICEVPYMDTIKEHLQQLHSYFAKSSNKTEVLKAASATLGLQYLKVKEVKDVCWLSQHLAVANLQRNLSAVLAEVNRCPTAKGLDAVCAMYRFVAALYLQGDVLPRLTRLSKVFRKEDVNFLAIKEQGSFLSQVHQDLDDPMGLGTFNIEERERPVGEDQDQRAVLGSVQRGGSSCKRQRLLCCKSGPLTSNMC
ncbi:uncharacterized protein LOC110501292 isoform X3 [Oncorhynchus mykiss]|uniref:uncharacterized protein LOC110501292 isoform X3 n=1 Tax=Oncorhynchus mykiss TaxID=8022 RepID=UPI001877EDFA|nr:uncharacterized protein LOC110501292 isoform X3 [Oncorhynchus mykiss]